MIVLPKSRHREMNVCNIEMRDLNLSLLERQIIGVVWGRGSGSKNSRNKIFTHK